MVKPLKVTSRYSLYTLNLKYIITSLLELFKTDSGLSSSDEHIL